MCDVGQNAVEEVDFQPSTSKGGVNYGWCVREGGDCYRPSDGCTSTGMTDPVYAYTHAKGCSVTGGYVYRGAAVPDLTGRYLYGDFCSNRIRSFVWNGSAAVSELELTATLASDSTIGSLASFGEDLNGELYVVDRSGTVFRIDGR